MPTRVSRRAALTGALAATMSGCSFTPVNFSDEDAAAPSRSADPAKTVDGEFFARGRDGQAKKLSEGTWGEQRVSTPHLDFTLQAWFVGPRLSKESAQQAGEQTELQAPAGHELLAFALEGGVPSYQPDSGKAADTRLVVDGARTIALPSLFDKFSTTSGTYSKQWEFIVLCVEKGADVKLQVVDEAGDPDGDVLLDLRTGVPVNNRGWARTTGFRERMKITCEPVSGVFKRHFVTTDPTLEQQGAVLVVGLKPDTRSGLLPWTPTMGWAPDGQQWLAVPMGPKINVEDGQIFPQLQMDVAASFQYLAEDGQRTGAQYPKSITTDVIVRGQELIAMWPVTGRDNQALIEFNPSGAIEVDYADKANVPATFDQEATPLQFTLRYAKL